jgi:hypothetical protein
MASPASQLSAPALVGPSDGQTFTQNDEVVLQWQAASPLPEDAFYAIAVAYSHHGQTWYDETPWTKDTRWALSEHPYLLDLSDDGRFRWWVQVMRKSGENGEGKPTGLALSPKSSERVLLWRWEGGGRSGPGAEATKYIPP